MLKKQNPFDRNVCEMIKAFFDQLKQPVCLVAHGGRRLDFPVLRAQFKECVSLMSRLSAMPVLSIDFYQNFDMGNIYCLDTMEVFLPLNAAHGRTLFKSFKLSSIYLKLFGALPKDAHTAESDTITLAKIAVRLKRDFVRFAEMNSKYFHQIVPIR